MVDVGPAGAASSGNSQNNSNSGEEDKKDERMFECNICLDTAKDAVISMCGHLFCWPCLHQWLETRPARQMCPVCKAAISKEKVIPLYGRGSSKQEDPRNKAPPRPAGQRTEPEANTMEEGAWWTSDSSRDSEHENSYEGSNIAVSDNDLDLSWNIAVPEETYEELWSLNDSTSSFSFSSIEQVEENDIDQDEDSDIDQEEEHYSDQENSFGFRADIVFDALDAFIDSVSHHSSTSTDISISQSSESNVSVNSLDSQAPPSPDLDDRDGSESDHTAFEDELSNSSEY